jgi:hypothetical protein
MKKLLILLLLVPSLSWGEQLKPMGKVFGELLEDGYEIDEKAVEYYIYRCAGLFMAIMKGFAKADKEISDIYKNHATKIQLMLIEEHFKLSKDKSKSFDFVTGRVSKIMDAYMEDMEDNWAKQGSYIGGSYIEDELIGCQDLAVILSKKTLDKK